MKIKHNRRFLILLVFVFVNSIMLASYVNDINQINDTSYQQSPKSAANGQIFSTKLETDRDCYINLDNPNLDIQPSLYLPNHYISSANMFFDNIYVDNYTKIIETESTEYVYNPHIDRPLYVYQKFYVRISQYVNNISIFIQDEINANDYNDANSWEVGIMNCTNDDEGTPNNVTLAVTQNPHPLNTAAHWETFDFQNSESGPVFLNTSKTISTFENGLTKYWFAFRVKIPANDTIPGVGGGLKYLYFNPDGSDPSDKGEGDTFLFYPNVRYENFTTNYVSKIGDTTPVNGTYIEGDLDSLVEKDEDRYIAEAQTNNLTMEFYFNIQNHSQYSYDYMIANWGTFSLKPINSVDIFISTKIDQIENIQDSTLYVWNYTGIPGESAPNGLAWQNLDDAINITIDNERILSIRIADPNQIRDVLTLMNTSDNNSLRFKFEYIGTGSFNVSLNKFIINFGDKIKNLNNHILRYDPLIQELYYPTEVKPVNGTTSTPDLETLKLNDNKYYKAQASTDNLSVEFKFEFMPEIESYLWTNVDFFWDWVLQLYPYQFVPLIELRIGANVSIDNDYNNQLKLATLEVYDRFNNNWTDITDYNKSFAFNDERQLYIPLTGFDTWVILNIADPDDRNSFWMRLRYASNDSHIPLLEKFNVTIDTFSMNFFVQNIFSSDICSKIGFGLNNYRLRPSDINMSNLGIPLTNEGFGNGSWIHSIANGIPKEGIFEFNVSSLWPSVHYDVIGTYQIYQLSIELDFKDDFEAQYLKGDESFTLEISDSSGRPISGLEINFELLDSNDKVIDEDTATTNSDGEATGSLELKDLGSGYKIKVSYDKEGIYASNDEESEEFRVVDEFTVFIDYFLLALPYILIGLAGLFIFVAVRHRRNVRLREVWSNDALVLEDLLKISYIMIIHKDAGLTLYNKQISMELDSDLIGGFITAISQFRGEIKKSVEKQGVGAGFEMDYHDFKIDMIDGEYIRAALILEGIPSEILKENQRKFTDNFEMRYKHLLIDFKGDIKPFKETDSLVEKFFTLSLMYPLQLGKHWEFAKLNHIERALLEVAEQMQKERNYFFVSSLLNYGLAGRKESKNQIISTIVKLKKRGLILPVEIK